MQARRSKAARFRFPLARSDGSAVTLGVNMIIDPRFNELAEGLTGYSTAAQKRRARPHRRFRCAGCDDCRAHPCRAQPRRASTVNIHRARVTRELTIGATEEPIRPHAEAELLRMQKMDAYIALRGSDNIFEASDVPPERVQLVSRLMKPVLITALGRPSGLCSAGPRRRWRSRPAEAQKIRGFLLQVCTLDYSRMVPGMKALAGLFETTDRVSNSKGPGTDLRFSIKDIGAVRAAVAQYSRWRSGFPVQSKIALRACAIQCAFRLSRYSLTTFASPSKQGRVVEATSNNTKRLNEILDSDAGARYIGEFALGFNPHILDPMRDILFDEKIAGSFHFTPGQAYAEADNGNKSQFTGIWSVFNVLIRWRAKFTLTGKLIRKDGLFRSEIVAQIEPGVFVGWKDRLSEPYRGFCASWIRKNRRCASPATRYCSDGVLCEVPAWPSGGTQGLPAKRDTRGWFAPPPPAHAIATRRGRRRSSGAVGL